MRIALFTSEFVPYPGGIATYCGEVATALAAMGHRVLVFGPHYSEAGPLAGSGDFEVHRWLPGPYSHARLPGYALRAARALRQHRPDAVIAADLHAVLALAWLPDSTPKYAVAHGTDVRSRILRLLRQTTTARPYRRFRKVIANSEDTRRAIMARDGGAMADRVRVVPLGVSDYWREAGVDGGESLAGRRQFLIVSVGRIEPRKGQTQAIAALSRLTPDMARDVTYAIVGRVIDEDYHAAVRRAAVAAPQFDVRLMGVVPRDDLRRLYDDADLLLHTAEQHPIRAEGFGLVLMEAAARGVPAIATRVDAVPEVVVESSTGLLYDDGDIDGIADGLRQLLGNPDRLRQMSDAARSWSRQFTWQRHAEALAAEMSAGPERAP